VDEKTKGQARSFGVTYQSASGVAETSEFNGRRPDEGVIRE